ASPLHHSLPLIQAPSLDFLVPALVLLGARAGSHAACRGQCDQSELFEVPAHQLREVLHRCPWS
ncbi:solute carrier family 23 member 3 isoform X1, partial [Tachysurus ichikawai]